MEDHRNQVTAFCLRAVLGRFGEFQRTSGLLVAGEITWADLVCNADDSENTYLRFGLRLIDGSVIPTGRIPIPKERYVVIP